MNKILLEGQELDLSEVKFPVLIHGEENTGASLYTISFAANLYGKGSSIVFLCGFQQAAEEFTKQIGGIGDSQVDIFTKDQFDKFKTILASNSEDTIIFIKNIELFGEEVLELVTDKENVVLSGDINKCEFINILFQKQFHTKILFSEMSGVDLPALRQYEGYFETASLLGKTTVKISG